jgi:hypothetical protein
MKVMGFAKKIDGKAIRKERAEEIKIRKGH